MMRRQKGFSLLEVMLALTVMAIIGAIMAAETMRRAEQDMARHLGAEILAYNKAVASRIAVEPSLSGAFAGTAWLKPASCGGTAPTEYLRCSFGNTTTFGKLTFSTNIVLVGVAPNQATLATTTLSALNIGGPRNDLSGLAAISAAAGAGELAGSLSFRSNPNTAVITMEASTTSATDVYLRTDGGNDMHNNLGFDGVAGRRKVEGVEQLYNLAGQALRLGKGAAAPSMGFTMGDGVLVASDLEVQGRVEMRSTLLVDGDVTAADDLIVTNNITSSNGGATVRNNFTSTNGGVSVRNDIVTSTGSVSANANVTAATGNITATIGDVIAGRDVSATRDIRAGRNLTVTGNTTVGSGAANTLTVNAITQMNQRAQIVGGVLADALYDRNDAACAAQWAAGGTGCYQANPAGTSTLSGANIDTASVRSSLALTRTAGGDLPVTGAVNVDGLLVRTRSGASVPLSALLPNLVEISSQIVAHNDVVGFPSCTGGGAPKLFLGPLNDEVQTQMPTFTDYFNDTVNQTSGRMLRYAVTGGSSWTVKLESVPAGNNSSRAIAKVYCAY